MAPTVTRSGRVTKRPARYFPVEPVHKPAGKPALRSTRKPARKTGIKLHGVTWGKILVCRIKLITAALERFHADGMRMEVEKMLGGLSLKDAAYEVDDVHVEVHRVHVKREPSVSPCFLSNTKSYTNTRQETPDRPAPTPRISATPHPLVGLPPLVLPPPAIVTADVVVKREDRRSVSRGRRSTREADAQDLAVRVKQESPERPEEGSAEEGGRILLMAAE